MNLSEKHIQIIHAEICPYCGFQTEKTTETEIYGKEYKGRGVIKCSNYPECNSYVGTHEDGKPLGRLANKQLRDAKISAHHWFDKIWNEGHEKRSELYKQLSKHLSIPPEYTHIGMFKIETCAKVLDWSRKKYNQLNQSL